MPPRRCWRCAVWLTPRPETLGALFRATADSLIVDTNQGSQRRGFDVSSPTAPKGVSGWGFPSRREAEGPPEADSGTLWP